MQSQNADLEWPHAHHGLAAKILDSLAFAVAVVDLDGQILTTNSAWQRSALTPVDGLAGLAVGQNFLDACRGEGTTSRAVGDHIAEGTERVIEGRAPRFELEFEIPDTESGRWFLLVVTCLAHVGAVVSRTETTTHHAVQDVFAELAFRDPLTGLPNRWLVIDRLRMAVDRVQRHNTWATVVFADLDGFKAVNDTFGHTVGDQVLAVVASRLRRAIRAEDTCGRWGGDEFVIVLELEHPEAIVDILRRLQRALEDPVPAGDRTVKVGVSLGVAMARDNERVDCLLELADEAMYCAKRSGRPMQFTSLPGGETVVTELSLELDQ